MSTIITRSTGSNPKGAPLTAGELDQNFINLNADKVESTRAVNTTAGDLTGGGDLSGDRTLGLASTGISAGTVQNSATQVTPLTLDIKGRVTAVGTPVTIAPDFSNVANKPTTLSGYGITDAQATITGAATTIDTEDLTASKVLISNGSGKVAASDTSTTTLGYLDATSSVQGQLDSKQATTAKNAANGYAGLDADAKLPTSLLPALAISEYLGSVANQAARLALTGQKGDWCSQTNDGKVYVISGDDPTDNASWTALTYPVTPGITLNGTSIAPGDTATISAATTNTLTIGTGLSGTSFNGSAATTIAIDSSVATLTGTQILTNKTVSGSDNTLSNIANASLSNSAITFGATSQALGSTVSALNAVSIGQSTAAAGAFTTLSASSTVSGTGFSTYLASPPAIGGTTPAAGSFSSLTDSGNLTFTGTGNRITGDFSNATVANRVAFQSSTVNGSTSVTFIPNGTSVTSQLALYNGPDINNATLFDSLVNATEARIRVLGVGTGSHLPMTFYTGGSERVRIDTSGNVGIGTSLPGAKLDVNAKDSTTYIRSGDYTASASYGAVPVIETLGNRSDGNTTFQGRFGAAVRRSDGTAIAAGHQLGAYAFGGQYGTDVGYTAANLLYAASIMGVAEGSFTSSTAMPTGLSFRTGSTGQALSSVNTQYGTERMRITSAGNYEFKQNTGSGNTSVSFNTTVQNALTLDASGNLISYAPTTAPSLTVNNTMVFNLTSNTNLRVSVRGSDGVTRTANITLA